jgi:hypothetical protein
MTTIVYRPLKATPTKQPRSVKRKRVRGPDGRWETVYSVDAKSPDFAEGITYIFSKNVARARAEQKKRRRAVKGKVSAKH